jgi:signal transduction histidine kinase
MGASVAVFSVVGEGSRFTVSIPSRPPVKLTAEPGEVPGA